MATVTMTGDEYNKMLRKIDQGAEIIQFLKAERKVKFAKDNINAYSSGKFPSLYKFPDWLQDNLIQDMVSQLLHMNAEEFGLWANTDHHYYSPKQRDFCSWNNEGNVDLLEYSQALKERWNLVKTSEVVEDEEANAVPVHAPITEDVDDGE